MTTEVKDRILEIVTSAAVDRRGWIAAHTQGDGIKRRAYLKAKIHLDNFIKNPTNNAWLIMPGLRGIGKTTILTQLYDDAPADANRKFFVSLERISLAGGNMNDVIDIIEEVAGARLDAINEPVFIFLDEVQFLDNWALALKTVYDRTQKVFIACTGSSAMQLQNSPDIARRSLKMDIYPLCFTEYVMIRQSTNRERKIVFPDPGLAQEIRSTLFDSNNETDAFVRLQNLRGRVSAYWGRINGAQDYIYDYIKFGTLPFTLRDKEEVVRWQRINSLLDESLSRDVDSIERFDALTRRMFPRLLFLLASSDVISLANLGTILHLNERTVTSMVDTLVETGIVHPVLPRGSAYRQVSRPTKYLFTSPAMRAALSTSGGVMGEERVGMLRGRLIEDMAGMYLMRLFHPSETPAILEYDYDPKGADFIISRTGQKSDTIAVEVGARKRTADQAYQTLQRVDGKYGLVVSGANLSIGTAKKSVFVPFSYFLLT